MAKVLLAGGGTAGHVNPLLATAHALRERGHDVAAVGTAEGLESDLIPRAGITMFPLPRVPFPRSIGSSLVAFPKKFASAVRAASEAIDASEAQVVVGFGGYVSTPVYVAAKRRHIPMVVHEANMKPGLANKLAARLGARVAVTFPGTPLSGAKVVGLPLRRDIEDLAGSLADPASRDQTRTAAKAAWGWAASDTVVLVTGGSLGAASLNAATVGAIDTLVGRGLCVIHLTGKGKADAAHRALEGLSESDRARYRVEEYTHDMSSAMAAADVVVCRSGAATVSEVTALGLPAIYVPLPHGNGEQALNAGSAVEAGAAVLIADAALTSQTLIEAVNRFTVDEARREAAMAASRSIGIRDGAARLVAMIEESVA